MIGDGYAMGIAAQVLEDILRATERWFGIDDPVLMKQWSKPGGENLGLSEESQIAGKMQLAALKLRLETGDKLAAKHTPEHLDGKKEARARSNPTGVIERQPAGWDDAMHMRMKLELLVPG